MGYRGGWSTTLTTINLMSSPGAQDTLSESLQRGAALAHRNYPAADEREQRNYRRSNPVDVGLVAPSGGPGRQQRPARRR